MTRRTFTLSVRANIGKLNAKIDRLIVEGKPYRKEAQHHANLVRILTRHA